MTTLAKSTRRFLGYSTLATALVALLVVLLYVGSDSDGSSGSDPNTLPIPSQDVPTPLAATHYPVPSDGIFVAPEGNDAAAGKQDSPLRTIAAAVKRAESGTTIVLRAGTYRETVGLVHKRLTIQPYPDEQVWVKGSMVVSQWTKDGGQWRHSGWDPALCRNCFLPAIIDPAHPLAGLPDMVFIDNVPQRQVANRDEVAPGTFFVDAEAKSLIIGADPTGKTVEASAFDRFLQFDQEAAAGSVLRGIGIAHYGSNQNYGARSAMVVVNARNVTIEKTTFDWSASTGLAVYQPNVSVSDSTFVHNGLAGLTANRANNLRLERNNFSRNNVEKFSLTGEAIGAAGAKITRTRNLYVADNVFNDNLATGWWCDLGCINATVIRNVAKNNIVNGLYYEVSSQALIASNLVVHNGRGLKISSSDRVRVYHNTFSANELSLGIYNDKREPSFDKFSVENQLSWRTESTELLNNYFAQPNDQTIIDVADYKSKPENNPPLVSRSDANAYLAKVSDRSRPLLSWSTGGGKVRSFPSLGEFQAEAKQEVHGLAVSPNAAPFTDPNVDDYTLRPNSPGINAALPLPGEVTAKIETNSSANIGVLAGPHPMR